ncbi:MAG TPA: alpha/beta hydrolase [Candidatus Elarobacter sp.]|jgi:pimeloyl-ACP methyl ester carboxylesterase|nr:alpha/beta hydrolase [Candidatus Elarobacter sp.]
MMSRTLLATAGAFALLLGTSLGTSAATLPTAPTIEAQYDSGSLHVERYGRSGDAVVLLPGLTTGTWEWNDLIRRLALRHTVYAVALPGFDGRPPAAAPLFDRFTNDFWSFIGAQKIARPVVVGHSLGGTLAILLGEQHPDRLRGIVAVDGLPIFPGMERVSAEQRTAGAQAAATQIAAQTHQQLLDFEKGYMKSAGGVIDAQLGDQLADLEAKSDPAAVAQWLKEDLSSDLRPDLAKISVPLLEIVPYYGPDLANAPVQYTEDQKGTYYRALLGGAPKVQVVTVSPARHFAMLDQPDRVFTLIDAFLAQNR